MPKARIFFIMQYEKHPETGEQLWSQAQIEEGLDHKTIKEWAWVYHDKDVWSEDDELDNPKHVAGQVKPPHWHVALNMPKNNTEVEVIARWFGVPMNFVEMKRGAGAFLDCVEYLTHEHPNQQLLGKTLYPDEEIHSNFEWRQALDEKNISRARYGTALDRKTMLRMSVLNGELSVRDVEKKYPVNFMQDMDKLYKLRLEYIKGANPPRQRFNYYLCGDGGIGKGSASICLARSLYPELENDEDIFFIVGAESTTFEGYDGQPVIIWEDCRSYELIQKLGSRGNVFSVFERFPKKQRQNVKFGSVNLINEVNIVNSVQPYEEFLNGLVGEYIDKDGVERKAEASQKQQSYRRFPFIMPLRADDFDILINKAFLTGSKDPRDYMNYLKYEGIRGNFATLLEANPDRVTVVNLASKMVRPALEAQTEKKNSFTEKVFNESDFSDYGVIPEPKETIEGQMGIDDFIDVPDDGENPFE